MSLEPCPHCGAECEKPCWDAMTEFSSFSEQMCDISCSQCPLAVSLTINPENLKEGDVAKIEEQLAQLWNDLAHHLKKVTTNE